jgi:ABC-type multidrug transport system permease subunit
MSTAHAGTPAVAHHGHARAVAAALAQRSLLGTLRVPATVIPTVVMPIFFTLAFSGAFGALTDLPVFPADNILDWMVPFAVLQGAAFAGFGAAFGVGRDLENGFYDRLLLAPTPRPAVMAGPLLFAMARAVLPLSTVVPIGLLGGARVRGGPPGFLLLVLAAVGVALCAGLWGLGVIYRFRTQRAGALVQVGIFAAQFLSVGQVPLAAMEGTWLHPVASVNPMTHVLGMARQAFLGDVRWSETWPGLAALAVAAGLLSWFAWRGFRKLVP